MSWGTSNVFKLGMVIVSQRNDSTIRKLAAVLLGTGVGWWVVVLGRGCAQMALAPMGVV